MTATSLIARASRWPRIGWAYAMHDLGIPGVLGLTLLVAATVVACVVRQLPRESASSPALGASFEVSVAQQRVPVDLPSPTLPRATDTLFVLQQFEHSAANLNIGWTHADYRINPLSDNDLSTLEIHTAIKGPYVAIRKWMTDNLDKQPALSIRDLAISRPNSDTLEVEAKLTLAVFLANGWPPAIPQDFSSAVLGAEGGGEGGSKGNSTADTKSDRLHRAAIQARPAPVGRPLPALMPNNSSGKRP